jgi:hypothetical protein
MKDTILVALALFVSHVMIAQKMMTRSGELKFQASMPALEEIAAVNNTVSSIFDKNTGEFAALVLVKGFRFKSPLMEEHFNENYVESSRFPKSTFKGQVLNFNASKLDSGKGTYDVEGDLTLHGVTRKVKAKLVLEQSAGNLVATSNFTIKPTDYGIEIPSVVKSKIAENVKIALHLVLTEK